MARFTGTESYIATEDLMMAVNAAVTLERPLLIKGEPGTGKTMLAIEVAKALDRPLQRDGGVDRHHQVLGGDVRFGSGEAGHEVGSSYRIA